MNITIIIKDWLRTSAYVIAKGGNAVDWVTPLGLPVVQPYHTRVVGHVNVNFVAIVTLV